MHDILLTIINPIPYAFLLSVAVLLLPVLAFMPILISSPKSAITIPCLNIILMTGVAFLLFITHQYTYQNIILVTASLSIIGICRIAMSKLSWQWKRSDYVQLLGNLALLLPMVAFADISVFMRDDALASWNYWATHFYLGEMPNDTMGYPQFFPLFLSFCFKLLNNLEYHAPVKIILCIFPLTMMNAISFINPKNSQTFLLYLLVIFTSLFPNFLDFGSYKFYILGYADPVLATFICISIYFLILYRNEPEKKDYLWFSIVFAISASLSKQPGLIWALFALPLIFILDFIQKKRIAFDELIGIFILIAPATLWLLGAGAHFYHNTGVMNASLQNHPLSLSAMGVAFCKSFTVYFLKQPAVFILYILAALAACYERTTRLIFLLLIIPGTLLWFIFGSYGVRLGLYLINSGALILAYQNFFAERLKTYLPIYATIEAKFTQWQFNIVKFFLALGVILFFTFGAREQLNIYEGLKGNIFPLNGGKSNIYKYFNQGADFVYNHIYDKPNIKLWVANRYIKGLFYGHTPIVTTTETDNPLILYKEIIHSQPDYLIISNKIPSVESEGLKKLIRLCPTLFKEIPLGETLYGYQLFRLEKDILNKEICMAVN